VVQDICAVACAEGEKQPEKLGRWKHSDPLLVILSPFEERMFSVDLAGGRQANNIN